jgi:hypothetical protein
MDVAPADRYIVVVPQNISSMVDLPASLLTNTQREVLANERNPSRARDFRSRVRRRVYEGLRVDGHLLFNNLSDAERRELFRRWEKDAQRNDLDDIPGARRITTLAALHGTNPEPPEAKGEVERARLREGITDLIAFLISGIDEGNIGETDEIFEEAFTRSARKTDRTVSSFELNVEMEGTHVLRPRTIAEWIRDGRGGELTLQEVRLAWEKGALSDEELRGHLEEYDLLHSLLDGDETDQAK